MPQVSAGSQPIILPERRAGAFWFGPHGPFATLSEAHKARADLGICPRCGGMFGAHFKWCKS